jgi:hypothetical protein
MFDGHGPGRDVLRAGPGADFLLLSGGADRARAGPGRDQVQVEPDRRIDIVRCGRGDDTVTFTRRARGPLLRAVSTSNDSRNPHTRRRGSERGATGPEESDAHDPPVMPQMTGRRCGRLITPRSGSPQSHTAKRPLPRSCHVLAAKRPRVRRPRPQVAMQASVPTRNRSSRR